MGIEVYRVNLSRVISKYIGETEKNLERIFDRLEQKNCILFFDEADALFGKRTEITEAKDRYANQEVAYLLQKIETFPNLVILSTNYRQNLDDAFQRRILSYIHVEAPKEAERLQLWQTHLPPGFAFDPPELLEQLAKDYQLTGANIANILKLASIEALSNQQKIISFSILEPILKQEFSKERRIFEVRQDRERRSNKYQLPNHATKSPRSAAPGNASKPRVRDVYDAMRIKLAEGEAIKNQKKLDGHGN
ncbi:MAG: ATP-binding protein [Salibacteraceae bacterium]